MATLAQNKKGYLRGVRGVMLTVLEDDGEMPVSPDTYWVDTAQEVGIEAIVVAGESAELRGGDALLVRLEEDDIITGATLTFRDARFDAEAATIIAGGNLVTEVEGLDVRIVGWEAPTIEEQTSRVPFQAEVYVQSFSEAGGREAYLKYTFRFCKGNAANVSHGDRSWGTHEFTVKAMENPSTLESVYQKEFVSALPSLS